MSARRRCPDCREDMAAVMVHDGNGMYVEKWRCPNAANHGKTVECTNCGEQVPGPQSHYSYTEGMIGSGRWNCISKQVVAGWRMMNKEAEIRERFSL